jgi:hypothetical protein
MSPHRCDRPTGVPCPDTQATLVLVCAGTEVASWPLRRPGGADLALVDELARLHLTAVRMGCGIRVRGPGQSLLELLELVGLGEVIETGPEAGLSG